MRRVDYSTRLFFFAQFLHYSPIHGVYPCRKELFICVNLGGVVIIRLMKKRNRVSYKESHLAHLHK